MLRIFSNLSTSHAQAFSLATANQRALAPPRGEGVCVMKQLPYAIALAALAASAITFAASPNVPTLPQTPSMPTTPSLPTPVTKPALPATAQPPLSTTQTVNCPDVAPVANPAEAASVPPVGKAPTLNTASVLGPKPSLK